MFNYNQIFGLEFKFVFGPKLDINQTNFRVYKYFQKNFNNTGFNKDILIYTFLSPKIHKNLAMINNINGKFMSRIDCIYLPNISYKKYKNKYIYYDRFSLTSLKQSNQSLYFSKLYFNKHLPVEISDLICIFAKEGRKILDVKTMFYVYIKNNSAIILSPSNYVCIFMNTLVNNLMELSPELNSKNIYHFSPLISSQWFEECKNALLISLK